MSHAGIHHVALAIEPGKADRAVEFWRLIGFERVPPPSSLDGRSIWMEAGPLEARTQIHLLFTTGEGAAVSGSANHVAVVVADFERALTALHGAGFEVEDRRPHWGAARAFARHPGGHTVELMAAPPPPAQ